MASFLSGLTLFENLGFISIIVPLLLITAVVYALLQKTTILGQNSAVNMIIGLLIGLIFVSVLPISIFLNKVVAFGAGVLVVIMILLMLISFIGGGASFQNVATPIVGWITFSVTLVGILIILIGSIDAINPVKEYEYMNGNMSAEEASEYASNPTQGFLHQTILNPVVLSLILMIVIAGLTAYFIARSS